MFATIHMKTVTNCLNNYGLRYDNLYDPMSDPDVKEAINQLPREVVDARNQRLLCAMDFSMKHAYLPDDLRELSFFGNNLLVQHDRVEIIANNQGNQTTPLYLGFTDFERLIGDVAMNHVAMNPTNTVFGKLFSPIFRWHFTLI